MIYIHAKRFHYDERGYQTCIRDYYIDISNVTELRALKNHKDLPNVGTINFLAIDDDLNIWFQCSGYDGRTGMYLKEWCENG